MLDVDVRDCQVHAGVAEGRKEHVRQSDKRRSIQCCRLSGIMHANVNARSKTPCPSPLGLSYSFRLNRMHF